jgi:hypothetical protein
MDQQYRIASSRSRVEHFEQIIAFGQGHFITIYFTFDFQANPLLNIQLYFTFLLAVSS